MAQGESEAPPHDPSNQSQPHAASSQGPGARDNNGSGIAHGGFWTLVVGCIGVVYGDIGTSPLYAFRESIAHIAKDGADRGEVYGIVSLVFWALMIVVALKYVIIIMQMDNKGEGGTLSLMALAQRALGRRTPWLFVIGVVGASLFYGDAIITPAMSVLSAVEGLKQVPSLEGAGIDRFVLPIGIGVLVGLFLIQSRGTGHIGRFFGPITIVWFLVLGALGAWHIKDDPTIVASLNPWYALSFAIEHRFLTFVVLGSIFLAVTGAEALYADMGHFGRRPIRAAWWGLILPALTLNYLGQGAYTLAHLDEVNLLFAADMADARANGLENPTEWTFSPFFALAPDALRLPLVVLATIAAIIASQAVISGAYSLTQQAIQLGLLPRMEIRRTSETQYGQIYMPQVNWILLAGVLILAVSFGSSTALASAYGISITGEMMMSTLMMLIVVWKMWKRPLWMAVALAVPFLVIEAIFFSSNMLKLLHGGYVPLLLAFALVTVIWTWVRGTRLLAEQTRRDEPLGTLFETLSHHPPHRVRGTAIFLTGDPDVAPAAPMHNLKHNQVLHEQIIILTVKTLQTPRAPDSERLRIEEFMPDVKRVTLTFGFMETPNVVKALTASRKQGLKFDIMKTSFFLSRRTVIPSEKSGMPLWQDHLFIFLARNATNATDFFHIPSGRAVELGNQVMV
ncbi:MAG: KUP system potassium uptake protein [Alphaproteobacteria bacterium]|nr:MAG: KUP system potassium uptake protein [Alphaproteobacteria bacterium]